MIILDLLKSVIGDQTFVLTTITISFLLKFLIVIFTLRKQVNTRIAQRLRLILLAVLSANIFSDFVWIQHILNNMAILDINPYFYKFTGHLAWAFTGVQYQGLALFLEGLITRQCKLTIRQKTCCTVTALLTLFLISTAFIFFNYPGPIFLIATIDRIAIGYYALFLLPSSLFFVLRKLRTNTLPHILTKQLYVIICGLIIPHLIGDIIQLYPFLFKFHLMNDYSGIGLSTLFLTIGLLYCSRKIMGLRFLNIHSQVQASPKKDFVISFKPILNQLSEVSSTDELKHMVQNFFEQALHIPAEKINFYLRPVIEILPYQLAPSIQYSMHDEAENFVCLGKKETKELLKKDGVLIYDDISFSHFYDQTAEHEDLLNFLDTIQADIFLPIYYKNRTIAYVIVERDARKKELFTSAEREEMLMFTRHINSAIHVLHNQTIGALTNKVVLLTKKNDQLAEEKEKVERVHLEKEKNFTAIFEKEKDKLIKDFRQQQETFEKELFARHQEMNQYRECLQTFLEKNLQPIGTLFYKNNRFNFGNQEAKDFITVNPNTQVGHPLVKKLKQIVDQVADFRSSKKIVVKNEKGKDLSLTVLPHIEPGGVIIIISPATMEWVQEKIISLKYPNKWDYLFYLETTKSGKLIDKLLPGNGKKLLDFKIELLQIALSKKATLLDIPEKDLDVVVDIIHQISLRNKIHALKLQGAVDTVALATKLFGINPLFSVKKDGPPLLELLHDNGTLFIKDVHLLNIECQEYLAEFIRYGSYRMYKSQEWKQSNVRIICSSNQDLQRLVIEEKFSSALFQELNPVRFHMPALTYLPKEELYSLAEGISQQATTGNLFHNLLALTDKDKEKLAAIRPASLHELRNRIKQLLMQKAGKNNINQETIIGAPYDSNDPVLIYASQLGKHALKDKQLMTKLWYKFDKNQSRIAEFLGVDRSSVHRRCRAYKLD